MPMSCKREMAEGAALYDPEHLHWTPAGHGRAAELLFAFLEGRGLL